MNTRRTLFIFASWLAIGAMPVAYAAEEPKPEKLLLNNLLAATENNDIVAFTKDGTEEFKAAMTQAALTAVHNQIGRHMEKGYHLTYLGTLSQKEHTIHLWKMEFKDGHDDSLVRLALKKEKVAGIFLQ